MDILMGAVAKARIPGRPHAGVPAPVIPWGRVYFFGPFICFWTGPKKRFIYVMHCDCEGNAKGIQP